jgi:hypothetical protein
MSGLVPGIHDFLDRRRDVDGRVKPGHDGPLFTLTSNPNP